MRGDVFVPDPDTQGWRRDAAERLKEAELSAAICAQKLMEVQKKLVDCQTSKKELRDTMRLERQEQKRALRDASTIIEKQKKALASLSAELAKMEEPEEGVPPPSIRKSKRSKRSKRRKRPKSRRRSRRRTR